MTDQETIMHELSPLGLVANPFAWRVTDPKGLEAATDPFA